MENRAAIDNATLKDLCVKLIDMIDNERKLRSIYRYVNESFVNDAKNS